MWSHSIEILNPYKATMDALAKESAGRPKSEAPSRVLRWMKSLGHRKTRPQQP